MVGWSQMCASMTSELLYNISLFQLHSWVKLIGILIAAGGAIEVTVTAPHKNETSSGNESHNSTSLHAHISLQVLGYVSLLLNTFCMVSCSEALMAVVKVVYTFMIYL